METTKCPFCESEDTFEISYLGAHPYIFQYTCTECGLGAPIGNGDTKQQAMNDAMLMLIKLFVKWKANNGNN